MPNSPGQIGFTPVEPGHYPLLRQWLRAPHVREWWGEVEEELGFIRDMVEGRDTTRPFLIMLDEEPVGYIQYWFVGHHQNDAWTEKNPWLKTLPADAVGVDLTIGEAAWLSRGVGSAALSVFVAKLRRDGFDTVIIDPDRENLRAVRAYEKAGFRPVPELEGRTGKVLIMQHHEYANETLS
ncbi:GNAT family N-acetyltransferase [Chelativorans sp. M5D2P16]|uniref:GNAT family N-acetyltransferase n=1 Tax=Chelativorans sp. M5D2P16 TaxID=3095678 RepID=UPI002ACAEF1A|nr:GNAT family N-acetyltransferase [Chelativorans sp. M5D2P16]MDZ5697397.1 GNAT family N-acetyltransferase [Chelativorans sp. M5D2P16]